MIELSMLLTIIVLHFISDFVLQTEQMALNKSSSNYWLGLHCVIYGIPFLILGWKYALINAIAHFIIDYITSRITKYLWNKEKVHEFFVVIGFDQMLHMITLVSTIGLIS